MLSIISLFFSKGKTGQSHRSGAHRSCQISATFFLIHLGQCLDIDDLGLGQLIRVQVDTHHTLLSSALDLLDHFVLLCD